MTELIVGNFTISQDGAWRRVYFKDELYSPMLPDKLTSALIKEIFRLREENELLKEDVRLANSYM